MMLQVRCFFHSHGRLEHQGIGLEEFQEREAQFVIMDRFSKKHTANECSQKFQAKLDASLESEQAPLEFDQLRVEHARLLYKEFDPDNNGISFSELKLLLKNLKIANMCPSLLRKLRKKAFKSADKDQNQRLDFQEFLSIYSFFYLRSGDFAVFAQAAEGIVINTDDSKARFFFNADQLESFVDGVEQQRRLQVSKELAVHTHKTGFD